MLLMILWKPEVWNDYWLMGRCPLWLFLKVASVSIFIFFLVAVCVLFFKNSKFDSRVRWTIRGRLEWRNCAYPGQKWLSPANRDQINANEGLSTHRATTTSLTTLETMPPTRSNLATAATTKITTATVQIPISHNSDTPFLIPPPPPLKEKKQLVSRCLLSFGVPLHVFNG